jgi:hypothetical protein
MAGKSMKKKYGFPDEDTWHKDELIKNKVIKESQTQEE